MSFRLFCCFCFLLLIEVTAANADEECINHIYNKIGYVGAVIDESSPVGKEQKLAMEMAVEDFNVDNSTCLKLVLHPKDSHRESSRATSAAFELVKHKKVEALVGALALHEAAIVSGFSKLTTNVPIVVLNSPISAPKELQPYPLSNIIRMSQDITIKMQCLADIVNHFEWKQVTAIYEQRYSFYMDLALVTRLSDSLKPIDAAVEHYVAFPPVFSSQEPEKFIEEELRKLNERSNRVFVILQSSFDFCASIFKKAKEAGMMGKGYVWIVSDDIGNLLDSMEEPMKLNMQGVIGFKSLSHLTDKKKSYLREFRFRFREKYLKNYPKGEEILSPSSNAFRAYDAIWTIAKAMENSKGNTSPEGLVQRILCSDFEGLSGNISFKNGSLWSKPVFSFINVIGTGYTQLAKWSPKLNLSEGLIGDLGMDGIYWPGSERTAPKGWTLVSTGKRLQIGVPAASAFNQFVKVEYNPKENVSGFSIDVFRAAVGRLGFAFPHYDLVPVPGPYDQMFERLRNKSLDVAIGDISILADRSGLTEFSLPYLESSVVMIVTTKPDVAKQRGIVIKAFKLEAWLVIAAINLLIAMVIYLNESSSNNPDFIKVSYPKHIASVLWFSVTFLSFSQRQTIRHNLSRLLVAVWLGVIIVVAGCFTAVLSSMLTVPWLQPSITSVEYLLATNAHVGCNEYSFISRYLVDVVGFQKKNIKPFNSSDEYPQAFKNGEIAAAFLSTPHSKVFLSTNCKGYTEAGPKWKLGGMGFAFQKGSHLTSDISTSILEITQKGQIDQMEEKMLSSCKCSSSPTEQPDDLSLGLMPFSYLLYISGSICGIVFIIAISRLVEKHWLIYGSTQSLLIRTRVCRWCTVVLARWYTRYGYRLFRRPTIIRRTNGDIGINHGERELELVA